MKTFQKPKTTEMRRVEQRSITFSIQYT